MDAITILLFLASYGPATQPRFGSKPAKKPQDSQAIPTKPQDGQTIMLDTFIFQYPILYYKYNFIVYIILCIEIYVSIYMYDCFIYISIY